MSQYMLSCYYTQDQSKPGERELEEISRNVAAYHGELKSAGAWVFGAGAFPPSTATVVRVEDDQVLTTDGPFAESKEVLGGFSIIEADDLDEALAWAQKAAKASTLPVEVLPLQSV